MPTLPSIEELMPVLNFTIAQAAVSALLAIVFGFIGALGLQWVGSRFGSRAGRFAEMFALIPNVAPVLVFIFSMYRFAPGLKGFGGVIVSHTLLNVGLISVALARTMNDKLSGLADLAWIEGAGRFRFLTRVAAPLLKGECLSLFLFVFAVCFASFAVPLTIGGTQGTTIETLIYSKIRMSGDWSAAFGLSILQFGLLLGLALFLGRETPTPISVARVGQPLFAWAWGLIVVAIPTSMIAATLFDVSFSSVDTTMLTDIVTSKFFASLFVASLSGILVVALLMSIAYLDPRGWVRRLLLGIVAPSAVITGFILLFVWRETGLATYLKMAIGLSLVMVPAFYRLRWDGVISSLRGQRIVAESLGASRSLIFSRIIWPQAIGPACVIAGLASLWAWGDFSLSRVVAEGDVTLALVVQSLMDSYRLELALALVWVLIAGSAVTFFLFEGAGRVLGSKSQA